jgi:hypothetical protein
MRICHNGQVYDLFGNCSVHVLRDIPSQDGRTSHGSRQCGVTVDPKCAPGRPHASHIRRLCLLIARGPDAGMQDSCPGGEAGAQETATTAAGPRAAAVIRIKTKGDSEDMMEI